MRAGVLDRFGGPEVLTLRVVPVPAIDPSDVLIAVHTAGVGSWDADMREGRSRLIGQGGHLRVSASRKQEPLAPQGSPRSRESTMSCT